MTLRCFSFPSTRLAAAPLARFWGRIVGLALMASFAGGCGAASTDTGNPPVVVGEKLRLRATAAGVIVSGDPGAVPAGARVDVVNTATGQTATTTAREDGSFELEVEGSAADEYRVYAASAGQSWRTRLTSSGAAPAEVGLVGLEFLLDSAEGYTPVPGTTIRLSFDADQLSFSAGCNSYSGPYSLCEGKLCASSFGGTEIGCEPARQTQDQWVADFMLASPEVTQVGATLTLAGVDATLEFLDREVADADRPLTGRTWTVDTFIENGAATNFPSQVPPTLEFGVDGKLTLFTTCNGGGGSYTRNGQTLTIASVGITAVECGPTGSAPSEQRMMRVLADGEVSFEIDAGRLTIMRGPIGLSATAE
jgi:heat shock protein HslJ